MEEIELLNKKKFAATAEIINAYGISHQKLTKCIIESNISWVKDGNKYLYLVKDIHKDLLERGYPRLSKMKKSRASSLHG